MPVVSASRLILSAKLRDLLVVSQLPTVYPNQDHSEHSAKQSQMAMPRYVKWSTLSTVS